MTVFKMCKFVFGGVVAFMALLASAAPQDLTPHEVGVVYYADGSNFKALEKEAAPASGRSIISAKIKGAHAAIRVATGQAQNFRLCSVDPMRYKLYTLRSTKNSREVTISTVNIMIGGFKSKLSESEIPTTIQATDNGCFSITAKQQLKEGEYGWSPTGEEYAFTFGVGEVKRPK